MVSAGVLIKELGEHDFERFREVIYRESGIKLSPMKKALVQSRLMRRMRELRIGSFEEYYEYLQGNYNAEIIDLINCITTNKTEFFREAAHFDYLRNTVLPQYEKEKRKELRIWCAGCSTGEEAYTIGITLGEYYRGKEMPQIRILATDIDTRVLDTARRGVYRDESVRVMDESLLKRYFLRGTGDNAGYFRVKEDLGRLVTFRRLNLLDDVFPMKKKFNIIFCRNVVIYFDKDSQVKLFKQFYRYLEDDGYLFIGHSETLTSVSELFAFRGKSIYGKVL